ncbi:glycosyltransferase family 2 protein [Hydrocarboniphaga sp.]|uniref:glycosyltransferase family 2 protein n=1 Tax=Hydrocarboniphaga sp. TaxID=2033016 RepID=UPI003D10B685
MIRPTVSLIVATYNSEKTLHRCLQSVRQQTESVQLIIVDNCSTDRTMAVAAEFAPQAVVCEKDRGVYDAWNKGIARASGSWIIFLGSDDYFKNANSIQRVVDDATSVDDSVGVIYGKVYVVDPDERVLREDNGQIDNLYRALSASMCFTHTGTLHRTRLFHELGLFNADLKIAGDFEFMLRALKIYQARFCPNYEIMMAEGGLSNSWSARRRLLREIMQARSSANARWSVTGDLYIPAKRLFYEVAEAVTTRLKRLAQ